VIRFTELEHIGLRIAAMSERADGDMKLQSGSTPVSEHRNGMFEALGLSLHSAVFCNQVHGAHIHVATAADKSCGAFDPESAISGTDGLVTKQKDLVLAIQIADCVPIFLFDPVVGACGLLHAGRVGTVAGIAGLGVRAMCDVFGCEAKSICAHVGPSAGPRSYQVSDNLLVEARQHGLSLNGDRIDLWASNFNQLIHAGIEADHIFQSRICTIADGRFFSYRRGDRQCRNLAIVAL
jgi:YfiH family protein